MGAETRQKDKSGVTQSAAAVRGVIDFVGYCWRWLGTALSFSVFGIGSLALGVVILPLLSMLIYPEERRYRWSRAVVGAAMKGFVWFMNGVGVLRYEISGLENIDKSKNYLILANHPSLIDVVFLLSVFPTADCVIKAPLKKNFFTRRLMNAVDYISNEDPIDWLQRCVDRLRAGRSLILFPEGTRTAPGQPLYFKAGAGSVAVRADVDCLPVVIDCVPTTLTKAESWYDVPDRRVFFSMQIQPSICPGDVLPEWDDARQAGRAFNRYLQGYFTGKLNAGASVSRRPVLETLG